MKNFDNVILGIDNTDGALSAFLKAVEIAKDSNCEIHLLNSVPFLPESDIINSTIELNTLVVGNTKNIEDSPAFKRKQELLNRLKEYLQEKGIASEKISSSISFEHAGTTLVEYAKKLQGHNIIIIGGSNKSVVQRFIIGSTAKYVVTHSPIDVLIVKNKDEKLNELKESLNIE